MSAYLLRGHDLAAGIEYRVSRDTNLLAPHVNDPERVQWPS